MREFLLGIVDWFAFGIGIAGVCIIVTGAAKGFWEYIAKSEKHFPQIRITLGTNLVLGLDFLVGKDIIDTLLLGTDGHSIYEDLLSLVVIVGIRIILTHFLLKELDALRNDAFTVKKLCAAQTKQKH